MITDDSELALFEELYREVEALVSEAELHGDNHYLVPREAIDITLGCILSKIEPLIPKVVDIGEGIIEETLGKSITLTSSDGSRRAFGIVGQPEKWALAYYKGQSSPRICTREQALHFVRTGEEPFGGVYEYQTGESVIMMDMPQNGSQPHIASRKKDSSLWRIQGERRPTLSYEHARQYVKDGDL